MTPTQKFSDFARRHEYGIILTSWAAALTGSFTYIMRDPYVRASWEWDVQCIDVMYSCSYQSVPQKVCRTPSNPEDRSNNTAQIVQARMWAQGLTIGIIIAAGVLTHSQRAKAYDEEEDHRFRHVVSVYLYARTHPGLLEVYITRV